MTVVDIQPVLFLDTNAVHYIRLYLKFAIDHNLPPVGSSTTDPVEEIKKAFVGRTRGSYEKGLKLTEYLRNRVATGARIEYSPITPLEIACGLLRGAGIVDATSEGITHRMWSQINQDEILNRLRPDTYEQIRFATDDLEDDFEKAGITIGEANPEMMRDVWMLARQILTVIFLDVGDSIVYASALLAIADELITRDGYFNKVINGIENPDSAVPDEQDYFRQVHDKIVDFVSAAIRINPSDVKLPKKSQR